jgi:hypothetical protein
VILKGPGAQALGESDSVVIAASTRRLTRDLFEYRDLGELELKGIAGSVPVWQALRPSAVASRFEALRGAALTPLVGRDEEIDLLLRRWARAKAGDGQVGLAHRDRTWKRRLRFMIQPLTTYLSIRSESTPTYTHRHFGGLCFSVSASQIKHWHRTTQH